VSSLNARGAHGRVGARDRAEREGAAALERELATRACLGQEVTPPSSGAAPQQRVQARRESQPSVNADRLPWPARSAPDGAAALLKVGDPGWFSLEGDPAQVEPFQAAEPGQRDRQRVHRVAAQIECAQGAELADSLGQATNPVVPEAEHPQAPQASHALGQGGQPIVVQPQLTKLPEMADRRGHLSEPIAGRDNR
jgi:hypothetical protein